MTERQIQWAEGMSAERFVQEAMLAALPLFVSQIPLTEWQRMASDDDLLEQRADELAQVAYALAEACHMQIGPDTVPRGGIKRG